MTNKDVHCTAEMLIALKAADKPLDVLALVCKVWIERKGRWSPWRRIHV